jgi:hypothetical protein
MEDRLGRWGLSLFMGGTRGFHVEGGPGHWKIIIGGPGSTRGDKTVADLLNEDDHEPPLALNAPRPWRNRR